MLNMLDTIMLLGMYMAINVLFYILLLGILCVTVFIKGGLFGFVLFANLGLAKK